MTDQDQVLVGSCGERVEDCAEDRLDESKHYSWKMQRTRPQGLDQDKISPKMGTLSL